MYAHRRWKQLLVERTRRLTGAAQRFSQRWLVPASDLHEKIAGEKAAFGLRMHKSNIFGAYLGNCASKGREIALQGLLTSGSAKRLAMEVGADLQPRVELGVRCSV